MKVFLRDANRRIVDAWEAVFGGREGVDVSYGDIFDLANANEVCDAIISPANSFGFMDIDLAYSRYFGWELQRRLQELIRAKFHGEIPVGAAAVIETGSAKIPYLVSAPTMRVPADVSNTVNAYLAFRAALIAVGNFNESGGARISSVLCPGLGTLTGGIPPRSCALQMKRAWDSIVAGNAPFPATLGEAEAGHKNLL